MEGGGQRIGRGGDGSESALLGTPSRSSAVLGTPRRASATLKALRTPPHSLALPCCAKPCYPLLSLQSPTTPLRDRTRALQQGRTWSRDGSGCPQGAQRGHCQALLSPAMH